MMISFYFFNLVALMFLLLLFLSGMDKTTLFNLRCEGHDYIDVKIQRENAVK